MSIEYLKKAKKTSSSDETKTREIVQNLLTDLEKTKEEGCKELNKKFDKYEGEIVISKDTDSPIVGGLGGIWYKELPISICPKRKLKKLQKILLLLH